MSLSSNGIRYEELLSPSPCTWRNPHQGQLCNNGTAALNGLVDVTHTNFRQMDEWFNWKHMWSGHNQQLDLILSHNLLTRVVFSFSHAPNYYELGGGILRPNGHNGYDN